MPFLDHAPTPDQLGAAGSARAYAMLAAADDARRGIRVNVLAPGSVRTDILTGWLTEEGALEQMAEGTPQGRIAEPEEMAPIVGWMLSDASSFMTGSVVTADGGYTAL